MSESAMEGTDTAARFNDLPLEIRGRVQHALSGEMRHFRDWSTLVEFLINQIAQRDESSEQTDVE